MTGGVILTGVPSQSQSASDLKKILRNDQKLIQIVDAALEETARRSGEHLVCHPGCTQCCIGVFPINQLDALRLRRGLVDFETREPKRAEAIRRRARESVARL